MYARNRHVRTTIQAFTFSAFLMIGSASASIFALQNVAASDPLRIGSGSEVTVGEPASAGQRTSFDQDNPEQLGDIDMAHRRYQAAIEAYHRAPHDSPAVWNKLGIANQQMLLIDEARKSYETSLKLDPRNPDVINNLGTVFYTLKQYRNAEKLYRKALKINPKSPLIYKNLGTVMIAEGKFKKATECFQTALSIDPNVLAQVSYYHIGDPSPVQLRGAMNYYLAKSYAHAGMYDRAIDFLRMAIDQRFADRKKIMSDEEFAALHGLPAFQLLFSEQAMQ